MSAVSLLSCPGSTHCDCALHDTSTIASHTSSVTRFIESAIRSAPDPTIPIGVYRQISRVARGELEAGRIRSFSILCMCCWPDGVCTAICDEEIN